ncbi:uncharacterized protein LOC141704347, partial [Apium graveolens]|uniref:uncharacterized protein LOC141704347 n=1 Tax=Apium graveolens TaxID=4045 RepID=UPI003D7B8524
KLTFLVSFVYAFNDASDRVALWDYCNNLQDVSLPWCLMGDFNCVLGLNEISGGREHWTPDMQVFKDCLINNGLGPIRTVGDVFTWSNRRDQNLVLKRLDRMVGNAAWFNLFSEGSVFVKPKGLMDHNPLLYEEPMQLTRLVNPSSFFNFMIDIPGFSDLVSHSWSQDFPGNPMQQFNSKLKNVKNALRDFNRNMGTFIPWEEHFLLQKSRVKWMHIGDGNNSFFHQQCKVNWNTNKVLSLHDEEGNMVHGQVECAKVAVSYFQSVMPLGTNATFISLIPKVLTPSRMQEFRPISLCTVMYKCISKIIASRLKRVLPGIINDAQSAFIPGRSISDNILLAQELFRGYDRETGASRCALKIDLHKAFDTINWDFIVAVLHKINLPVEMISWIRVASALLDTRSN